jgi:hypothetical protein
MYEYTGYYRMKKQYRVLLSNVGYDNTGYCQIKKVVQGTPVIWRILGHRLLSG